MRIYNYSPRTGEFLFASTADASPLEPGKYLIPADATEQVPPPPGTQQVAVFKDGAWTLQPDLRGQKFYRKSDGIPVVMASIGVVPYEFTTAPRPSESHSWDGASWKFSAVLALAAIRTRRNGLLSACDWTQVSDVPLNPKQKTAWNAYRQALRDFPATCDPTKPVWPTQP
ncbi:MAG: tail fiber assembly protein [Elusimicrobiales bacterium]